MWNGQLDLVSDAAEYLTGCLLEMAEAETNPVLEVIDIPLLENKKYPPEFLTFNQLGWRAYYHCHPSSRAGNHRFKGEHGHFHIFVRLKNSSSDEEEWSHLVALAMDNLGQPLGWFSVNHWVTGEKWQAAESLIKYLDEIPYEQDDETILVETWLLSLLALSRDKVKNVLFERDNTLNKIQTKKPEVDMKQNRDIYLLSEKAINLMDLLNISKNNIL